MVISAMILAACSTPPVTSNYPALSSTPLSETEGSMSEHPPRATTRSTIIPNSVTATKNQRLSTPQLIDQAVANGEIASELRLLYLAYAVYEYESLPIQFRSNVPWDGTFYVKEIKEAIMSPSVMCTMSLDVRSELLRLLRSGVTCDQ
jgi:hypothetical protein